METDTQVPIYVTGDMSVSKMPAPKERVSVYSSLPAGLIPQLLLSHSPRRRRATLTVCGLVTDTAYLASSSAEAAQLNPGSSQVIQGGQVLFLTGSSETWLIAKTGVSIIVGVAAEYEEI